MLLNINVNAKCITTYWIRICFFSKMRCHYRNSSIETNIELCKCMATKVALSKLLLNIQFIFKYALLARTSCDVVTPQNCHMENVHNKKTNKQTNKKTEENPVRSKTAAEFRNQEASELPAHCDGSSEWKQ